MLAANLAHGEQRQLEIAMALATGPRLLLLDEPMAGMGIEESQRMIALLRSSSGEDHHPGRARHGRGVPLADRISVLVYGRVIATDVPRRSA